MHSIVITTQAINKNIDMDFVALKERTDISYMLGNV